MHRRRVVIVGSGPAGIAAATAARRTSPDIEIVLLGTEGVDPYEKPPLSKAVLTGGAEPSDKPIVPATALASVQMRLGVNVTNVDLRNCLVLSYGAQPIAYDALVLATGAALREHPLLLRGEPDTFYLRDAADAMALRAALTQADGRPSVAVVGAGLIGLEVAAAAAVLGAKVTVIEAMAAPLGRVCSRPLAEVLIRRHFNAGVMFRWAATVDAVLKSGSERVLRLSDGSDIPADIVVVGIGVRPETNLAARAGLAIDDGILVDDACRTSDPIVYAAGDVARFKTSWCSTPTRLENWRHALEQGEVAGINATGGSAAYSAIPSFWSDQYELMLQGVGWPDGLDTPPIRRDLGQDRAIEFHVRDGRLRYAVGIGAAREVAVARRLIERRTEVNSAMLADPSIALPSLMRAAA